MFPNVAKMCSNEGYQANLNSGLIQILFSIRFANPIKIIMFLGGIKKNKNIQSNSNK